VRADHFSPDVQDLVFALHTHGVRYLLVGGEAVIYHGYTRLTGDVDFWYEATRDNAVRLHAALEEFWDGVIPGIASPEHWTQPNQVTMFGKVPHRVDLLSTIDGVRFPDAWPRRLEEALDLAGSRRVLLPIIGADDLLTNKRAAGRHKDLDDVENLERLLISTG
jgi:hypothetical protein